MQVSIDLPNMVSGDVTVLCFPLPNQGRGSFFFWLLCTFVPRTLSGQVEDGLPPFMVLAPQRE
jgi:hypothetical protein